MAEEKTALGHLAAPGGQAPSAASQGTPRPEHTPGPWFVVIEPGELTRTAYVRAPSWGIVANVGLDPSLPHWDELQRVNAYLIAAAPDLLQALREVSEVLDMALGIDLLPPDADGPAAKARAAIAKATGSAT